MPGLVRSRSASEELGNDSEQASSQSDNESRESSSEDEDAPSRRETNANKRRRLSPPSEDEDSIEDSWALSAPNTARRDAASNPSSQRRRNSLLSGLTNGVDRSKDRASAAAQKWKPGQIVRVSLKNFVTYNSITFRPGPSLNMVIGPNGTGKSTLVCAICIGLGWGTQHLGRAKELSEFVKHGCDEFEIIIELKGEEGKVNSVVQHNFRKDGAKKSWLLNDRSAQYKDIRALMAKLNIQVDNLCQFLPQDRVVEFSQLSGIERLTSTQRAAAPQYMTEWYEQLKGLRSSQRKAEDEQATQKTQLTNLEARQNAQRVDVERMRERTDVIQKVDDLKDWTPMIEYNNVVKEFKIAKAQKDTAVKELSDLEKELEPAMKALSDKQVYEQQIGKATESRIKLVERFEIEVNDESKKIKDCSEQLRQNDNERGLQRKSEGKRKGDMQRTQNEIDRLQREQEEEPIEFDAASYTEAIREQRRQINDLKGNLEEIRDEQIEKVELQKENKKHVKDAEQQITNLQSLAGQQEAKLAKLSPEGKTAWDWIRNNRESFKGEVYGPPMIECTIKDTNYASVIESLFQTDDFLMITCTEKADFDLLLNQLTKNLHLKTISLRHAVISTSNPSLRCPISQDEMSRLGFDGMAIDFLEGPDPVLAVLCEGLCLHRTGVALNEGQDQLHEMREKSAISSWVTKQSKYNIIRRQEYGEAGHSMQVRNVAPAKIWTRQAADNSAEGNFTNQIARWNAENDEVQQALEQLRTRVKSIHERMQEAEAEKGRLEEEKDMKQRAHTHYQSLPNLIEQERRRLADLRDQAQVIQKNIKELRDTEQKLLFERCEACIKHANKLEMLRRQNEQLLIALLARAEAVSDVERLQARHQDTQEMLDSKRREVQTLLEISQRTKAAGRAARDAVSRLDEELVARFNAQSEAERERTRDEHQAEIEAQSARLELLHEGNPRVITEFEERAHRIETLAQKISEHQVSLAQLTSQLKDLRAKWEPELDALVAQISTAFAASFEKIGCAGEVSIYKAGTRSSSNTEAQAARAETGPPEEGENDNDFDQWAIHISVKFREGETLSLLDSHRQSGGERAVSTIFYLMALQQLSRAPFRVVDEINQGMDPRNERVVHERLVDLACGVQTDDQDEHFLHSEDSGSAGNSQYFLITPKLLDGLKYVPGMKVLNIISGEWLPENSTGMEMDFSKLASLRKQIVGGRRSTRAMHSPLVNGVGA